MKVNLRSINSEKFFLNSKFNESYFDLLIIMNTQIEKKRDIIIIFFKCLKHCAFLSGFIGMTAWKLKFLTIMII